MATDRLTSLTRKNDKHYIFVNAFVIYRLQQTKITSTVETKRITVLGTHYYDKKIMVDRSSIANTPIDMKANSIKTIEPFIVI